MARRTAASSTDSNEPRVIYRDLMSWLPNPPPQGKYALRFGILVEGLRFALRHLLGFDLGWYGSMEGFDEETLTRTWMRLGEIECLGGNPHPSSESLLYVCFKTLNVVETVDDEMAISSPSRVYANAAIQVTLALQGRPTIAGRFARYFWKLAMYSAEIGNDDESAEWVESLLLDVHDDDHDEQIKTMINSKVWDDALYVMKKRFTGEVRERRGRRSCRGADACGQIVQNSSKSTIPIEILSGFQSLHNLYTVFQHLIVLIISPPSSSLSDTSSVCSYPDSTFDQILSSTSTGTIAHWYAVVGAAVEAFWKGDIVVAETLVRQLKDLPKNSVTDCSDGRAFEESTKQIIGFTLVGVAFVKRGKIVDGMKVLEKARKACRERRRISTSSDDLESSVRVLAEFVAGVCGLEAWIDIWRTAVAAAAPISNENEKTGLDVTSLISAIDMRNVHSIIGLEISALRRKMETQPLNQLDTTEDLLRRLCELGEMVYNVEQFSIDSGCDSVSDDEHEANEQDSKRMVNVGERALRILKGYKV